MQNTDTSYLYCDGPDAAKFLQGQLTCDLKTLTETPVLAAHCNPKGRIISLFWIFRHRDGVLLQMPNDLLPIAKAHLDKYRVFFKASLAQIEEPNNLPEDSQRTRLEKIQQGIPTVYASTSEQFLPHRINLTDFGGVSFKKGCYTGQEIIARMEHRGEVKHHLYQAKLACSAKPGDKLSNGAVILDCIDRFALVTMKDNDAKNNLSNNIVDLTTLTFKETP